MSAAENISFNPTRLSPEVLIQLTSLMKGGAAPEKEVESPSTQKSASSSKRVPLFASPAPLLTPKASNEGSQAQANSFIASLVAYMLATLFAQLNSTKNDSLTNQNQTDLAQNMTQMSQGQLDKAKDDLKTYLDAVYEAAHQSWWQKLLGILGAVIGTILAGITGGACAFLVAVAITALMTVPVDGDGTATFGKLDSALEGLGLPAWSTALIKTAIVVAATVVGNAAGASAEAGLGMLVNAAKSAEQAAMEDLGAVGGAVVEDVGAAGAAAAQDANAAGQAAGNAAQNANAAGQAAAKSDSFLSKVKEIGFSRGNIIGTATQMTFAVNPFVDVTQAILNLTDLSDEKKKIIAQAVGTAFAIFAAIVADQAAASGATNQLQSNSLRDLLGPKTFRFTYNVIDASRIGLDVGSGVFGIEAALSGFKGSDAVDSLGKTQAAQSIYTAIIAMANEAIQRSQQTSKATAQAYQAINNNWSSFVQPFAYEAQILG